MSKRLTINKGYSKEDTIKMLDELWELCSDTEREAIHELLEMTLVGKRHIEIGEEE